MSVAGDVFDKLDAWAHVALDVPIFVEHEVKNPDGSTQYRVGKEELEDSARRINEAWGSKTPVAFPLGHSKLLKDAAGKVTGFAPQAEQPPVAAFGGFGAYVAPLGDRLGLYQRKVFYRKEHWEQAKECPHRSAEYYWTGKDKGRIPAVALLKTPAELNLGVTLYQGDAGGLALYGYGAEMIPGSLSGGDPTKPPDNEDEPMAADKEKFHRLFAACYPALAALDQQLQQGPQAPQVGQPPMTAPAAPVQPSAPPPGPPAGPPQPAAYQGDAAKMAQYEAKVADLEKALAATQQNLATTQQELKLQQYGAELHVLAQKHVFDVGKELKKVAGLDRAAFDLHKAETVALYQLRLETNPDDPTGPMIPVADAVPDARDANAFTGDHLALANQYMVEHPGCAWGDARAFAKDPKNKNLLGKGGRT